MSYDVYLMAETGGEPVEVWERNHTSNTAAIWRKAGCDIAAFDGLPASELGIAAASAMLEISEYHEKYLPLEPSNGWGTLLSTVEFLGAISMACAKYPATTVRVSR